MNGGVARLGRVWGRLGMVCVLLLCGGCGAICEPFGTVADLHAGCPVAQVALATGSHGFGFELQGVEPRPQSTLHGNAPHNDPSSRDIL